MFGGLAKSIFGSSNDRYVKSLGSIVQKIAAFEPQLQALSDEELSGQTAKFREQLANGIKLDDLLPEAFATVREAAVLQGRILGATDVEVEGACTMVARALAHPVMRRARDAEARGECRRESPVTLRADDGTLLEGVVDLAFLDGGTWTVVDYKTDADPSSSLDAYARQVTLYARAVSRATGRPAVPLLLRLVPGLFRQSSHSER